MNNKNKLQQEYNKGYGDGEYYMAEKIRKELFTFYGTYTPTIDLRGVTR